MSRHAFALTIVTTALLLPLTVVVAFLSLPQASAWGVFLLACAQHALLFWFRDRPTLALLMIAAAAALQAIITGLFFLLPSNLLVLLAMRATAARGSRAIAVGIALIGSCVAAAAYALDSSFVDSEFGPAPWLLLVLFLAVSAVACTLGWLWRSQKTSADLVRERELQEHRERESRAADEERHRISRDLHDILAHSLAVVISQVRIARFEPEHSVTALTVAEETARSSLAELRTTLGVLRESPAGGQSGIAMIDILRPTSVFAAAESVGIRLTRTVRGTFGSLDDKTRDAIGWLIREALTNAAKHAPQAQVDYSEVWEPERLTISFSNDRMPGAAVLGDDAALSNQGLGLRGMTERVAEVGGVLSVRPGRRFTVSARMPIGSFREA